MRKICSVFLVLILVLGLCAGVSAAPSSSFITTAATGCDSADDVVYQTYTQSGKTVIANWGARGESCVFLSSYAEDYYTGDSVWDLMSGLSGGTTTSNAPSSELYLQLQALMEGTHSFYTYYDGSKNVRDFYCYTDCVSSDISQVALLYRGGLKTSQWNQGSIWNQEHVWPKSKLHSDEQIGDIMHLRPANPSENSSRGNKAYGESSGYYDPGVSVRGDCARMVLYMYVRWGVTDTMWGSDGVMESLEILLQWMEEDPVDTWEMGRNDAVQSITGVRNVFVDYPEYAWLLFGQEVPEDMVTPSGEAANQDEPACTHTNVTVSNAKDATCGTDGYTGDGYCAHCGVLISTGTVIPATGEHTFVDGPVTPGGGAMIRCCSTCGYEETVDLPDCQHESYSLVGAAEATCAVDGYTGNVICDGCACMLEEGQVIPATGEHTLDETGHCTGCDYYECLHQMIEMRNMKDVTCGEDGHTGDVYCADCGQFIAGGSVIPATGEHIFDHNGRCTECGYVQEPDATQTTLPDNPQDTGTEGNAMIWICIAIGVGLVIFVLLMRRSRKKKET